MSKFAFLTTYVSEEMILAGDYVLGFFDFAFFMQIYNSTSRVSKLQKRRKK